MTTIWLAALSVALLAGCGPTSDTTTLPRAPSVAAPPQEAELGWDERYGDAEGLRFGVERFAVVEDGWRADVSVTNETTIAWALGGPGDSRGGNFGVMLFTSGELGDLEARVRSDSLPALRAAQAFTPELPAELEPGETWTGSISAQGALAAGRWLRVSFGDLVAIGEPPEGLERRVVWITDNAYQLKAVAPRATPA